MTMTTANVLIGLVFIIFGFLTYKFPWMIKQWRYANEEQRRNIDIEGLKLLCCKSMVISGLALIVVGIISYFIEGTWSLYALIVIAIAMSGYMVARSRRYDKNPVSHKKQTITAAILAVTIIVVVGLFVGGKMENKIDVTAETITIHGMYGETISLADIDTIYMSPLANLPKVEMRTNGYADGTVFKGYFRLTDWGKCKLFIHDKNIPVIVIHYNDKHLIFNLYTEENTQKQFELISSFFRQKDI